MNDRVVWRPEALEEFEDAIAWYAERSIFAADRLIAAFKARLTEVLDNPQRFPISILDRRWTALRRFPFQLHYMESGDQIVILAFWHEKRDRKTLQPRLRNA